MTELPQWHFHGHAKEKNEWPYGKGKREGNNKNGIVIAINHVTNEFFSILNRGGAHYEAREARASPLFEIYY